MDTNEKLIADGIMPAKVLPTTRFKNHFNGELFPLDNEVNDLPSLTQPDQSLTVAELMYRYTHGQSLGLGKVANYEEEGELQFPPEWEKLDLSEKRSWLDERAAEYEEVQERLDKKKAELQKKEMDDKIEAEVQRKLAARREMRNPTDTPERKQGEIFNDQDSK